MRWPDSHCHLHTNCGGYHQARKVCRLILCRGVLEAERRANRWFAAAQEGYRAFQDAGDSVWRTWRSLLTPWQQMVLVSRCLRGRFRYGTLRSYADWSLGRFVPYLLVLAAVSFGGVEVVRQQHAEHDRSEAKKIRDAIGFYEPLSRIEGDHLWKLANSSDAIRDSFFKQALESSTTAEQFNRRADVAIQAAVGLDLDTRERVFRKAGLPCLHPPEELSIKVACIRIALELAKEDGNPQFVIFALKTLIEAVEKTTDSDQLTTLAGALKAVPGKLDRQQLINLLKWPLSVGVLRSTLLDLLEQQTDKKFDGDLWKMVTWAQQNGIDVKSPPKRPDKSLTTQQERTTWGFLDLIPLSHSPPQPGPLLRLRANLQR
jgi:hypothetical protein